MKIPHASLPLIRLVVLATFTGLSAAVFGYFWTGVGGSIPLVTEDSYQVEFEIDRVNNLVPQSDVTMAGIIVGNVERIATDRQGDAHVVVNIDDDRVAPLHEGVSGRINAKTLVEETYVSLRDGQGAAVPSGAQLPDGAIDPAVTLDDVLESLGSRDREALGAALRSLGAGTTDSKAAISAALEGLGDVSRHGGGVMNALARQSTALKQLSANTARVLAALDTRQGQIAQLVEDANHLTRTTSGSARALRVTMRRLPGVLATARDAGDDVSRLAGGLQPVVTNLDRAAPALNAALRELPATSADLRALLPALNRTLQKAPPTLTRLPTFARDAHGLVPHANRALANLNPMLSYVSPYGPDIVPFFVNFGLAVSRGDANGTMLRVMPVLSPQSFKSSPVNMNEYPLLDHNDPYQPPGSQEHPPSDGRRHERVNRSPLRR